MIQEQEKLERQIDRAGKVLKFDLPSRLYAEQIRSTLALLAEIRRTYLGDPDGILSTDMLLEAGLVSFADLGVRTQLTSQGGMAVIVWNPGGRKSGGPHLNSPRIGVFVSDKASAEPQTNVVLGTHTELGESNKGSTHFNPRENLTSTFQPVPTKETIIIAETFLRSA